MAENLQKINRYTNFILPVVLVFIDYLAIVCAESLAFNFRNWYTGNTSLYISWLNFWVVFPLLYLIFLNIEQLYNSKTLYHQLLRCYKHYHITLYSAYSRFNLQNVYCSFLDIELYTACYLPLHSKKDT